MKTLRVLALLLVLPFNPLLAADQTSFSYYVPPQQFNAELHLMDQGFSNIFVLFQNGTASFTFDENAKLIHRLRIAVDTTSIVSTNASNQRDVANLLGASQFSEIDITAPDTTTFTDGKAEIMATAVIHGISKPLTLQATLNSVGKSARAGGLFSSEGEVVGLSIHTDFKRSDFGMASDVKLDTPDRFGDTLTLSMELQGIRQ